VTLIHILLINLSMIMIVAMLLLVFANVVLRYVFNSGIYWSEEVALLLMVWTAFIAMAIGVEKSMHISISIFYNKFPKWLKTGVTKLYEALTTGFGDILWHQIDRNNGDLDASRD